MDVTTLVPYLTDFVAWAIPYVIGTLVGMFAFFYLADTIEDAVWEHFGIAASFTFFIGTFIILLAGWFILPVVFWGLLFGAIDRLGWGVLVRLGENEEARQAFHAGVGASL